MSLRKHMQDLHPRTKRPRSTDDFVKAHKRDHHRFVTNHVHVGVNLGAGDRPPGWTTGEDVKLLRNHTLESR